MPPGLLTLIGSGETSERLLNLHHSLLKRLAGPRVAFLDTPAGFQLNAGKLSEDAAAYFKKHFSLDVATASYRRSSDDPEAAVAQLQNANFIFAGPGSPTYAASHWRGSPVWQAVLERWQKGAQLVFASSAAIAIGRWTLPVYEIYKVGADPYWADGLDLLGPLGFELAIVTHYDNREGRPYGYDTRFCFVGEPRLLVLDRLLSSTAVVLGIDEDTACTLDFESGTAAVEGPGRVTLRYQGKENHLSSGTTFDLKHLRPLHALDPISSGAPTLPQPPPLPTAPVPAPPVTRPPPPQVLEWATERDRMRGEKKFAEADALRARIAAVGYTIKDSPAGPQFALTLLANSNAVPSHLDEPDACEWSVNLLAHNNRDEILRAARSALHWSEGRSVEVVIVDNGSDDGTREDIAGLAAGDELVRPAYLATDLGEGAGRNAGFRASRGKYILILGSHMEIAGDVFTPLAKALGDESIGAAGSSGLITLDLFTFSPAPSAECDAIEFYLFAFRRDRLTTVGLLDEKYVFYRNLDLDWSLAFKDKGLRLAVTPGLPLTAHEHPYLRMDPAERDRLSKKNYRRFLDKWRERKDLLLAFQPASPES